MNQPPSLSTTICLWTQSKVRELFSRSMDVQIQQFRLQNNSAASEVVFIYCSSLVDTALISETLLPQLHKIYTDDGLSFLKQEGMAGDLPLIPIKNPVDAQEIGDEVFQGNILLLFTQTNDLLSMDISSLPKRSPEESNTEISIKGPKDGFTEEISTNIGLIRKRIRSTSLCCETSVIGRRTRTKVALMFFQDLIPTDLLKTVQNRLHNIDVDGIISINQLEAFLSDSKYSVMPLMDFTGRPDYVVSCLLNGRFILLVDGNPMVLIGPAELSLLLKSPEDIHFNYFYVSFVRIIRGISLILSVVLPAFWVSLVAFHQDQIPFRLMATISTARAGLPLSAQMEVFLLLVLLEIFREAGVRLPSSIGQTLTVIGGLIIGDAAIRAGLVSPSSVVVGSLTAVMGSTLVNQTLSAVMSVIRFALLLVSSFLGMYGLILGVVLLIIYISRLRTFGRSYLAPISPLISTDFFKSILRAPWSSIRKRPAVLNTVDSDHQGESRT